MSVLASIVNGTELLETVAASFVAAMAVTVSASIGIWGGARYEDLNQEGRSVAALMALGVGVLGLALTLGIIVLGIYLMVSK